MSSWNDVKKIEGSYSLTKTFEPIKTVTQKNRVLKQDHRVPGGEVLDKDRREP